MLRKVILNDLTKKQKQFNLINVLKYFQSLGYKYNQAYELVSIWLEIRTIK